MEKIKYDRAVAAELAEEASNLLRQALDKMQAAEALMERELGKRRAESITRAYEHTALARNELFEAI